MEVPDGSGVVSGLVIIQRDRRDLAPRRSMSALAIWQQLPAMIVQLSLL
jgi:hypothetical protein